MLDAWGKAAEAAERGLAEGTALPLILEGVRDAAREGAEATKAMMAGKGRAARLGDRSLGHIDPGAASAALIIDAWVADWLDRIARRANIKPPLADRRDHDLNATRLHPLDMDRRRAVIDNDHVEIIERAHRVQGAALELGMVGEQDAHRGALEHRSLRLRHLRRLVEDLVVGDRRKRHEDPVGAQAAGSPRWSSAP